MVIFLETVSSTVPVPRQLANVPILIIFFAAICIILASSVAVTSLVLYLYHNDRRQMTEFEVKLSLRINSVRNILLLWIKRDTPDYVIKMKEYYQSAKQKYTSSVPLNETKINGDIKWTLSHTIISSKSQSVKKRNLEESQRIPKTPKESRSDLPPEHDGSGYRFLGDMINIFVSIIVTLVIVIQFVISTTLMTIDYHQRIAKIKSLSKYNEK